MGETFKSIGSFFSQATADTILRVLGALLMLVVGFFLIKHAVRWFEKSLKKSKLDQALLSFGSSLLSIVMKAVLIITAATYLGVPSTSFIALLSTLGLAVGLALQGSLGNFAGGLMLLLFHPFRVGDYIKADAIEGTVVSMNIMYTQLATFDKKKVIVPNSSLSNGVVTNFSAFDTRRVDISFSLDYASDIGAVNALMMEVAARHPLVLKSPAPDARMGGMSGGLLVFTLRSWCHTADFWPVTFDLNEGIKLALDAGGFRVPPPQSAVRVLPSREGP
ncbi:MAG: mechanosensitive ion channel family protein [Christensenellales bacterium]